MKAHWADRRLVGGAPLFNAALPSSLKGGGEVNWEWSKANGTLVAREIEKDGLLSLVVTAEMTREERDALVTGWILRLWWDFANRNAALE